MWQASLLHILLFKMPKWKQKTLAAFGFKKKVMNIGKEINVDIPKKVDLQDHFKLKYLYCIWFVNMSGKWLDTQRKHSTRSDRQNSCLSKLLERFWKLMKTECIFLKISGLQPAILFRKSHSIFSDFLGNSYILFEQLFWWTPLVECFWRNEHKCKTQAEFQNVSCKQK